jgi:uncharacterized protein involved in response to NO
MLCWLAGSVGMGEYPWAGFTGLLWHGHEMLFGLSAAVVTGFLLTAIPSWAETSAVQGKRLMLLAGVWLAGRLAVLVAPLIPLHLLAIVDLAFFPVFALLLLPTLFTARNKTYLVVLLILAGFFYGNLLFYMGMIEGNIESQVTGLRFFLYTLIVLYTIVGGFLTPIFTENELQMNGWQGKIVFHHGIEALAIISILLYAAFNIYIPDTSWSFVAGVVALLANSIRMARWQSLKTIHTPMLWVMHLSYLWFLVSIALNILGDMGIAVHEFASIHAFTVGAFGMMKISFFCRVSLRHTGRPLKPERLMVAGFVIMFFAALARVSGLILQEQMLVIISAPMWILPFLLFLWFHGAMLIRPSLDRAG